jgi:serine/threonine protein kinase/WD40 repeat protein
MEPGRTTLARDPLERLVEDYLARRRRGEAPTPGEYAARWPEHADRILDLFPALDLMERLKPGPDDEPAAEPEAGDLPERMGDYRILRVLGRGGMGVVYEAVQESLGRHVALKVLPGHARADATQRDRFRLEARSVARLHHANIVPVFAVGEHQGVPYYAMQIIAGHSLDAVLDDLRRLRGVDRHGPAASESALATTIGDRGSLAVARSLLAGGPDDDWTAPTVVPAAGPSPASSDGGSSALSSLSEGGYYRAAARIALQVAEALAHAHDRGVLHRDIKPSNLMLDADGHVWVTDFGLAKLEGSDGPTRPGDVVGTLRYMAPERFDGWSDRRSDVYSLGATLYELLTLRPAFDGLSRARLVERIVHAMPVPPRRHDPRIPRDLETVALKAIAKEPADRYPTARALADDLRRFLEDRPIRARRTRPVEHTWRWCRRNPSLATLLALVLGLTVALAVGSTIVAMQLKQSRDRATARRWESYLAGARARRASRQVGQRFGAIEDLSLAAKLRASEPLRDESIASLTLVDVRLLRRAAAPARGTIAFDDRLGRYAVGDQQGRVRILSASDDRELAALTGPGGATSYLRFLPGGHRLLAVFKARERPRLVVWDLDSMRPLWSRTSPEYGMAASPDGARLAVAGFDGSIDVVETATGRRLHRLWLNHWFDQCAFDPGGRLLAVTTSPDRSVRVFDVDREAMVWSAELDAPTRGVAWRDDGRLLAVGCDDYRIYVWDMRRKQLLSTLVGHENCITRLEFPPGGDLLVSSTWDSVTKVWDPVRGTVLVEVPGTLLQAGSDGHRLGMADIELRPGVWELAPRQEFRLLHHGLAGNRTTGPPANIRSVDIRRDGRLLASAAHDGVRLWDVATGAELAHLDIGPTGTTRFSPDGSHLLTSGTVGLRVWPVRREVGSVLRVGPPRLLVFETSGDDARAVWDGSGRRVAAVSRDKKRATVWDIGRPEPVFRSEEHPGIGSVAISPDGGLIATATWHGRDVKVWDVEAGTRAWEWPCDTANVSFSADGRWLVTFTQPEIQGTPATTAGGYRLWEVGTWRPGPTIPSPNSIGTAAFTRDGRLMAVHHADGRVPLIEPATGRAVATLDPPPGAPRLIQSLAFGPDGRHLAAGTSEGVIQLWDLGLLRAELSARGLDWSGPPLPPGGPGEMAEGAPTARLEGVEWFTPARLGAEHADAGRWDEAASAYAQATSLGPDDRTVWYRHLLLRLKQGDRDGYRRGCAAARARLAGQTGRLAINELAWYCVLGPEAVPDFDALIGPVAAWASAHPDDSSVQNTLGALLCRAGRFEEASAALDTAIRRHGGGGTAFDHLFLALSCHRLGRHDESRRWLARADDWIRLARAGQVGLPDIDAPLPWEVHLELDLLRREADTLVSPPVRRIQLRGLARPAPRESPSGPVDNPGGPAVTPVSAPRGASTLGADPGGQGP